MATSKASRSVGTRFAGVGSVPLEVIVKVGEAQCSLGRLVELKRGEVIHLNKEIGDAFELRSGEVLLARVEPVAHNDGIAVKIVEIPEDDDDRDSP